MFLLEVKLCLPLLSWFDKGFADLDHRKFFLIIRYLLSANWCLDD